MNSEYARDVWGDWPQVYATYVPPDRGQTSNELSWQKNNPVDDVILLVPEGFIVVTPAFNSLLTVKLSLTIIVVE